MKGGKAQAPGGLLAGSLVSGFMPAINILLKLMSIVAVVFAPLFIL
ncbi:MAG: hypothetical protein PHP13_07040 [Methanomicrobium sp.]|nr:hypothetical protein [Methanomicrobium sp.]MDD4299646.1 hypothetical protein [Methanomicrobium sp.]